MAERLTNTLEETPTKGFGLKFCSNRNCNSDEDCCNCYAFNQTINKLRQLEDIMAKYGIESVEELSKIFSYLSGRFINSVYSLKHKFDSYEDKIKYLANKKGQYYDELYETKQDRDTWQRACELACEWFKQTGFIGDQTKVDYFYQQAKTEGNDEK